MKVFKLVCLLLLPQVLVAQMFSMCDNCVTEIYSLTEEEDSVFKTGLIQRNSIHEVTMRYDCKQDSTPLVKTDSFYRRSDQLLVKFMFDSSGYIDRKYFFTADTVGSVIQYRRDSLHRVTKLFFAACDSFGNIDTATINRFFTATFTYKHGRLHKKFIRDERDFTLTFVEYTYSKQGRLIREYDSIIHRYHSIPLAEINETKYAYRKNGWQSVATINRKTDIVTKVRFDKMQRVAYKAFFDKQNNLFEAQNFFYAKSNRLLKHVITKYPHTFHSEFPDKWIFINRFMYNAFNLPETIYHHHQFTDCYIRLNYR